MRVDARRLVREILMVKAAMNDTSRKDALMRPNALPLLAALAGAQARTPAGWWSALGAFERGD